MNNTKVKVEFNGVIEDTIKLFGKNVALEEFDSEEEWLKDSFRTIEELLGLDDFDKVISDISFIDVDTGEEYRKSDYYEID
ncbi:MAG: hypothetical protein J5970_02450 [Bacilli bacterium]|nr:hypothetical protein [Bacilli bacterium]